MVAKAAPKKAAAKATPAPETNGKPVSPYGDVPVFTWTPKDGGEPILFPKATTVIRKGEAFRFFYKLNKLKGDTVGQFVFMMDTAGIPESIQDRAAFLPDDEVMELISAWTAELRATPGES